MKTRPMLIILSACLLGTSGVWVLTRPHAEPIAAPSARATGLNPAQTPTSLEPASHAEEASSQVRESIQPRHRHRQADEDELIDDSYGPMNTQNEDANRTWARCFPARAAAWMLIAPEGTQRDAIAEVVCADLAATDPVEAVALAEHCLGGGTNRVMQNLLDNVAQQWAGQDLQSAGTWALTKPAGEQRDRLLQRIAFVEATTNPKAAAQRIVEHMTPGPAAEEAAISVLHQWALQDSAAALAWAESFPTGTLRERAIGEVRNVAAVAAGTPSPDMVPQQ